MRRLGPLFLLVLFAVVPAARAQEQEAPIDTVTEADDLSAPVPDTAISDYIPSDSEVDYAADPFADIRPARHAPLPDPLSGVNRVIFKVNGVALFVLLKPVATAYRFVIPTPVRSGVKNVFRNLSEPLRFASALLQGRPRDAGKSVARLLVNSTVGIGGLFNVAAKDLSDVDRDFDQTLAAWGIPPGLYLMLPLGGPSSVRDAISSFGESFLDPINYIRGEDADAIIAGAHGVKTVNDFSFRIEEVDALMKSTVDPYAAVKAYYEERLPNDAVDRTR